MDDVWKRNDQVESPDDTSPDLSTPTVIYYFEPLIRPVGNVDLFNIEWTIAGSESVRDY